MTGLWSLLTALAALAGNEGGTQAPPPGVLFILTDDQGYADVGVYGATGFRTPRLDGLAAEGVRCTDFCVAQPVCSASRAAFLTGCYPNRIGMDGALGPRSPVGIHEDEMTLGELCRSRGYRTAFYGKWHLGCTPRFLPTRHGFDEFYGIPYSNDMWPHHPETPDFWGDLPTYDQEEVVGLNTDQSRFTRDFTRRAVDFIEGAATDPRPFLVVLSLPMPHVPLHVSEEFRGSSEQGLYGDVIQEIDAAVGRLLDALEHAGLADSTLVIFTSDNGPWLSYGDHAGFAGPLREGKGTTFEGGIRVPCILRWPGHLPAGRVCDAPWMAIDLFPTLAARIGAALPEHGVDGKDVWPLLVGEPGATSPHEAYFYYYDVNALEAVRSGRWKLHFPHSYRTLAGRPGGSGGVPARYETAFTDLALYDLTADPGETRNVVAGHPDVVQHLRQLAAAARADLGDSLRDAPGSGHREPGREP